MSVILQSARLVLRQLSAADLEFVAEMLADPLVMQFWPRPYTRSEATEWIRRQQDRYLKNAYGYWLAIEKETGLPVGQAGLLAQEVNGKEETGLGYIMHRPSWRRGFAFEAAAACREHAFDVLGKERVIAPIRPGNLPSRGVAEKLGMTNAGQTQFADYEHLIYQSLNPSRNETAPIPSSGPRPSR